MSKTDKNGKNRSQQYSKNQKKNTKKGYDRQSKRSDSSRSDKPVPDNQDNTTKISEYSNDPGWWENNNGLTENATNIGTRTPIGYPLDYGFLGEFTPTGILRLDYAPCFGSFSTVVDAVNVAAKNLYNKINAQNSRSSSYDPNDLAIYIIAVANAWTLHSWLRRLIGAINSYSAQNRYWFDPLLESMHVVPVTETNDVTKWINLADWIALQLDRLPVPEDIAYYVQSQRMCEAFYADNLVEKAGIVYLNPVYLLRFNYDDEGKGKLEWAATPWKSSIDRDITPAAVRSYFEYLTQNLFNDSDTIMMQSDIRRAFSTLYTLGKMDPNFSLGVQYDANLNLQIRNATLHPYLMDAPYEILQDMTRNVLKTSDLAQYMTDNMATLGLFSSTVRYNTFDSEIFDFPTDNVSSQSWTEATKLHAFWNSNKFIATCQVVLDAVAFTFVVNNGVTTFEKLTGLGYIGGSMNTSITGAGFSDLTNRIQAMQKFANAPMQFVIMLKTVPVISGDFRYHAQNIQKAYVLSDLNNFVPVPRTNLSTIRDYAQLSILTQGKFGDNHLGVGKL